MTCNTNVGGIALEQAMIKGTADATITAEKVLIGEIGYGANGERIIGNFEGTKTHEYTMTWTEKVAGFSDKQVDCGFRPSVVVIRATKSNGTTAPGSSGFVDPNKFSYTNGTQYNFGSGPYVGIEGISDGAIGSGAVGITGINDNGYTFSLATANFYWTNTVVTEFVITAYA